MPEDNVLIKRSLEGDRTALEELFRRYEGRIFGLCYQFVRNREDALDLCQDVFIRILRALSSFDLHKPFFPWAKRIAINTCLNHLRDRNNGLLFSGDEKSLGEQIINPVEDSIEKADLRREVRKCLDSLPDFLRLVLVLRHYEDMSYGEIAEATGLPLGTVKTHLYRAREILRKKFEKQLPEGEI